MTLGDRTEDPCEKDSNYTLVRYGTYIKCNTCGGTSGCSRKDWSEAR